MICQLIQLDEKRSLSLQQPTFVITKIQNPKSSRFRSNARCARTDKSDFRRKTRSVQNKHYGSQQSSMDVRRLSKTCKFRVVPLATVTELSNHPDFVGFIPILLENPESRPMCDRDRKNPNFDSCCDIFVKLSKENEMQNTFIKL